MPTPQALKICVHGSMPAYPDSTLNQQSLMHRHANSFVACLDVQQLCVQDMR